MKRNIKNWLGVISLYDEEIEKAVLFYMIFKNEDFELDEKDFINNKNKQIITAINQLKASKKTISMLNISEVIKTNKGQVLEYLSELGEYVFGTTAESAYNKLINYSKKRQVYELVKQVETTGFQEESSDVQIEKIIKDLKEIQQRNEKVMTFEEQVLKAMNEIEMNYNNKSDYSLYTGLLDLDKLTLGLHKQELTVIGARPGVGKTTMALQIAEHIARKGLHIGFVSLEMSETQLIQKIVSRISRVNGYKLRAGNLEEQDFMNIADVCGDISKLPFHIISQIRTIQEIEVKARQLKNKGELDLLIIDYLQLVRNSVKFGNREQEVADISRTLKLLSLELRIPIIALCQLNRNANKAEPTLADLRESGAIEQDADNVIFLYQESEAENESAPIVIAKLAKQRAGDIGKVKLKFKKISSEFISLIR